MIRSNHMTRRSFVRGACGSLALASVPSWSKAAEPAARSFDPRPGTWRTFEVVTTIQPRDLSGSTTVWVPVPSISSDWQRTLDTTFSGNASEPRLVAVDNLTQCVVAHFAGGESEPILQVTNRIQTQNRAADWTAHSVESPSRKELEKWVRPTALQPTDGIVRKTARQITQGVPGDLQKAQRIYDWIIVNTYREPKVRGCGLGDIKTMLETGNLGGKCADINGLFVGLCRATGLPARDAYGVRLAPSAFGYHELGGNPASLQSAQHCRSEVYVREHGWLAMDPADVDKVMRQETSEWIKDADHPIVAPVRKGLFGGWEGNWMAYNQSADIALPGSSGSPLPFFMYPQAENAKGRYDSLDATTFTYTITARELST
jgi:transglutaminase-like putative cysteine protease